MSSLWLDHVLATPTIGLQFESWFLGASDVLEALRGVLEAWRRDGLAMEVSSDQVMRLIVKRADGITVTIDAEQLIVQFTYRGELKERPAQVPTLQYVSELQPYTALHARVLDVTARVAHALHAKQQRGLRRFGLVASSRCEGGALPPGVALWVEHQARPWGNAPLICQTTLTVPLPGAIEGSQERCHHTLDLAAERGEDVRVSLDWQRIYAEPRRWPLSEPKILEDLRLASGDALRYFERFGEGDLDYGNA